MVNTMVKRDLELYEKEVEIENVVREDGTEVTTSYGETIALRYHTVKTVFQTKNSEQYCRNVGNISGAGFKNRETSFGQNAGSAFSRYVFTERK